MRDVYVLRFMTGDHRIVAVADDFERCSVVQAAFPRDAQRNMTIENHDLLEDGD